MTLNRSILVVASVEDTFDDWAELAATLKARVGDEPASFRVIVPATSSARGREGASGHLSDVLAGLQESGLAADGCVGHSDPMIAVHEAWDPSLYDEIIISTLPSGPSKWLHAALPERVAKVTGAHVTHHVREPAKQPIEAERRPVGEPQPLLPRSPLVPLSVLEWGGRPSSARDRSHDPAAFEPESISAARGRRTLTRRVPYRE
jgi:hypothetical protein